MRIPVTDLARPKQVLIQGDEAWLARIYGDFPLGTDKQLMGKLTVEALEGGAVTVKGNIAFSPVVACSRCEKGINWPLSLTVDARFLPERANATKREVNLSESDLDAYYLDAGEVDIEQVLTDVVQTALPSQILATSEDGSSCRVCKVDLTEDLVYGESQDVEEARESPFAALKGLKLKN